MRETTLSLGELQSMIKDEELTQKVNFLIRDYGYGAIVLDQEKLLSLIFEEQHITMIEQYLSY